MAYYAPFYRPTYYNPMQTDAMNQFNQQMQQPMTQPMQTAPVQQTGNGLIWVQGESAAKSFPVSPNCTVMLMDSEGERFYLKSADSSGMPMPLRIFDYTERNNAPTSDFKGGTIDSNELDGKYVTREEFEQKMASMASQCQCRKKDKNKLTEDAENGEPTV